MCRFPRLVLCSLLLAGCAGRPVEPPDWVAGNSAHYPASRYLLGRGQGETPAVARDRARADLAKSLRVQVSEESRDLVARSAQSEGESVAIRLEAETSRHVVARTDEVLEGVRIAEAWQVPTRAEHHALAVLDRVQAAARLRHRAAQLDARTREAVAGARDAGDSLLRAASATSAVEAQRTRAALQEYLAVLDPSGRGAPPVYDLARLEADREAVLRRVRVAPVAPADSLGGLERALSAGLAAAGFSVATVQDAEYVLEGRLNLTEHPSEPGWRWVRGTLEVALRDREGTVRGAHRWDVKASAQQAELARERAADEVSRALAAELGPVLLGFAAAGAP